MATQGQATLDTVAKSVNDLAESVTDIATSLADLTTMMANEFTTVRQEMATKHEMATGFAAVHSDILTLQRQQRETNERLARLEDNDETHGNDIRALYEMISELQENVKSLTKNERLRLADLEAFALQVAEKTGIPFHLRGSGLKPGANSSSKPKLRS